jgi:hypothetical protein
MIIREMKPAYCLSEEEVDWPFFSSLSIPLSHRLPGLRGFVSDSCSKCEINGTHESDSMIA